MKKMMAVYDEDAFYAERLSDYVNRKEKGIFTAQAFTSKEKLEEFAKKHEIDVLLTGENAELEENSPIVSGSRIYLSEEQVPKGADEKKIYKYQSGDDIIREVMAVYCETPGVQAVFPGAAHRKKRIVGIYSPIGRCGKTSLSLAVGQLLAKEEKVLFVSLDTFTGFSRLLGERWKRDLSDLIYYFKQGRFNVIRLNSIIYYLGDMAWLPPIRFPEDYNQMTTEEMASLMEKILEDSDYTTLVLDLGDYGRQMLPLLEICHVIYMPVKEDIFSQAKQQEFEEYVDCCGNRGLKERFQKIHVPMVTGMKRMEHFPQELLWGDLGDFVRGMLKGQKGLWES